MSEFEFILILIAIVAGFAITEILRSWGRLIRAREGQQVPALYGFATFYLLILIVRYVWILWGFREVDWHFGIFVLTFVPILIVALAAYVISVPRALPSTAIDYYFAQARPFYLLIAGFFAFWTVSNLVMDPWRNIGFELAPAVLIGTRGLIVIAFVMMAFTRKAHYHWLLLAAVLSILVSMSFVAVPEL